MLILDLNQIMISSIITQLGNHTNTPLEEDLVRHMVLNTIRSLKTKFSEYGELVIACDDKQYWRRDYFPPYKGNRKKDREKSDIDWSSLFNVLNKLKQELKDYFPYRVIQVQGAEADDVIAVLCYKYGVFLNSSSAEKIMILSGDKDFIQLQKFANVSQYDPVHKKVITDKDPANYLFELVLRGDRGDGIPNVLSPDNCLIDGLRQKPLTAKKIQYIKDNFSISYPEHYFRNKNLIDFDHIPEHIHTRVIDEYTIQNGKDRSKLFNYFVNNKLKNLMEHISEF